MLIRQTPKISHALKRCIFSLDILKLLNHLKFTFILKKINSDIFEIVVADAIVVVVVVVIIIGDSISVSWVVPAALGQPRWPRRKRSSALSEKVQHVPI